jgi:hypothetical protein
MSKRTFWGSPGPSVSFVAWHPRCPARLDHADGGERRKRHRAPGSAVATVEHDFGMAVRVKCDRMR